jgi:hypothetical protein
MKYEKKTKPALWTTLPAARKRLEAAAASRSSAKATLLAARRGKVAAKATKRRLERSRQPRKRIAPRSAAMVGKMAVYGRLKGEFLAVHRHCAGCYGVGTEVHHTRGRAGTLLLDTRYWLAMCPACHRWVHENINEARQRNLIAAPGDWNNPV